MRTLLTKSGTPGREPIGINEISSCKGHTNRNVESNLIRQRPRPGRWADSGRPLILRGGVLPI